MGMEYDLWQAARDYEDLHDELEDFLREHQISNSRIRVIVRRVRAITLDRNSSTLDLNNEDIDLLANFLENINKG